MIVFYRLLFLPIFILLLPYYLRRYWKRGKLTGGWRQRLGFLGPIPKKVKGSKRVWIQAVSVGELNAISPLIESLLNFPAIDLILSTTTLTAYKLLQERFGSRVSKTILFPLDFWPFRARAWSAIKPDLMLLTEGDLWPEHLYQAKRRQVPAVLLNARLSDRSFRRYQTLCWLTKPLLSQLSLVCAASQQDYERFIQLGCPKHRITLCGNLKIGAKPKQLLSLAEKKALKASLGLARSSLDPTLEPLVILGCSTWPGEEALLLEALKEAHKRKIPASLLLLPRHPERRQELLNLLKHQGQTWHFRSSALPPPPCVDVYIADSIGELPLLAQVGDLAFIGKSTPPHKGGQSPLEVAALGLPMVYGPNMSNFRGLCTSLEEAKAVISIAKPTDLLPTLLELLQDKPQRKALSQALSLWYQSQEGVLEAYLQAILPFLEPKSTRE